MEPVAAPWAISERQDAVWLQAQGFRPKNLHQPDWGDKDKERLRAGLVAWSTGSQPMPSEQMNIYYYLSHYVMDRKFSAQACRRLVKLELKQLKAHADKPGLSVPPVAQGECNSDVSGESEHESDSESADEAVFCGDEQWFSEAEDF